MPRVYLIGSLRNKNVPIVAGQLREHGFDVFDDWYAAGPEADDFWQKYEQERGHTYPQALKGHAATHVFEYDLHHLTHSDIAVLLTPAGKSGHLEFGVHIGLGKKGYILIEEMPERWDVMYRFATGVFFTIEELLETLKIDTAIANESSNG